MTSVYDEPRGENLGENMDIPTAGNSNQRFIRNDVLIHPAQYP